MINWLLPLFAFLLGSIPFGLLIAKAKGINIRKHGSGNIGATNVFRVIGKKYGITCFVLDFFKGFVPAILAYNLLRFDGADNTMSIAALTQHATVLDQFKAQSIVVLTGLCSILGHNFSPWVGFKGGKGIATSGGVLTALMPVAALILIAIWFVTFKLSRYVSLASVVASASLPLLCLYGSYAHGKLANGTWNKPLFIFCCLISVMAVWKHRTNISRLLQGTEHRFGTKK